MGHAQINAHHFRVQLNIYRPYQNPYMWRHHLDMFITSLVTGNDLHTYIVPLLIWGLYFCGRLCHSKQTWTLTQDYRSPNIVSLRTLYTRSLNDSLLPIRTPFYFPLLIHIWVVAPCWLSRHAKNGVLLSSSLTVTTNGWRREFLYIYLEAHIHCRIGLIDWRPHHLVGGTLVLRCILFYTLSICHRSYTSCHIA